ncbi:hypothetical protein JAAARDRAFT_32442 [Jaapia argillacea MUCL 33604]|uniref:NAD(P)-binding protein n=1 Tax=Jaapia argillacea MUCL 33604 TaxID=933084 RepID=A0A067Q1N2_9AGAM|nr:hypothetical protein JAAARDRAFT_32442 [Jaapia argillacea MUCL 33604]
MFWRLFTSGIDRYRHGEESWALVTGGSDGIGKGLCEVLASKGFNVFIHGRNQTKLVSVLEELKVTYPTRQFEVIVADATNPALASEVAAAVAQKNLTILINNAGYTDTAIRAFVLTDHQEFDKAIAIGVGWITHLTRELLPLLMKNEPSLMVNVGSYVQSHPPPFLAVYSATKGYTLALTQSLRTEMQYTSHPNVEIQYHEIHSVSTHSNRKAPGLTRPTAHRMAEAIVGAVGSGRGFVVPYWPHELVSWVLWILPEGVVNSLAAGVLQDRRVDVEGKGKGKDD